MSSRGVFSPQPFSACFFLTLRFYVITDLCCEVAADQKMSSDYTVVPKDLQPQPDSWYAEESQCT